MYDSLNASGESSLQDPLVSDRTDKSGVRPGCHIDADDNMSICPEARPKKSTKPT